MGARSEWMKIRTFLNRTTDRILAAVTLLAMLSVSPAFAGEGDEPAGPWQYGAHASTLGPGISAGYDVSGALTVRGLFSRFDYGFDRDIASNDFDGDLKLSSLGLVADWHPLDNALRLTAGAFFNGSKIAVETSDTELDIGGGKYHGNLDADIAFRRIAPYVGVGWTSHRGKAGFSFSIDAGVLYQGSPKLTAAGRASGCAFTVSGSGTAQVGNDCPSLTLKDDLQREHRDIMKDLDHYKWYPMLSIGMSYRF
jgi:hypothetical protein